MKSGDLLLHYRIGRQLGQGGMGVVFLATDTKLDRLVAIKCLPADRHDSASAARFIREAKAASALNHPGIITIYEFNQHDGSNFIVMEYVEGQTLAEILRSGPLPMERAVQYAVQIADALSGAHLAGLIHRDLKPGNIIVTPAGRTKILDFGLAKRQDTIVNGGGDQATQTMLTQAGVSPGTPAYMSPEQVLGREVDSRSDIFAFGVILYEMLAGARPFQGASQIAMLNNIAHQPPPPLCSFRPETPEKLKQLIERCLEKDPALRPVTMAEVRDSLNEASLLATAKSGAPSKKVLLPAIAGALAVVAFAAAAWTYWPGNPGRSANRGGATTANLESMSNRELVQFGREQLNGDTLNAFDRAIAAFSKALESDPNSAMAQAGLAEAYLQKHAENPDPQWLSRATDAAEQAVKLNPQLAASHISMGSVLLRSGKRDQAESEFREALSYDPTNPVANSRLGNLLAQRNQSVEAEKFLRAGVQNGPDLWLPRVDLGLFLCRQDRCVEGLNELLEAARRHPNNPVVFRSLGAVYHLLGRDDEAAASLQKSLSIRPERRQYSTLGAVLFFQGKYREALGAFEKAISMGGGNDYLAWGNLADAYRFTPGYGTKAKEAYANAIELGRKALAKNPKDLSIASSIAGYLAKNGQSSEAVAQLATIEAEPGLKAGILYKCALAREITGFRELALSHLEKAVRQGYPMKEVANDPELIELRKDPRYQRISAGKN